MKKLIQLLSGEIKTIKLNDGRRLTLVTARDTEDDSEAGFYLDTPLRDGSYQRDRISNRLGYTLISTL